MNREEELRRLEEITEEYNRLKESIRQQDEEILELSRVNKAVQFRANLYLGAVGVMVLIGLVGVMIYEFGLMGEIQKFLGKDHYIFYKMLGILPILLHLNHP